LRAFEVHALDYLLKPFDDERFFGALQRAKDRASIKKRGGTDNRLAEFLDQRQRHRRRFLVRHRERSIVITAADIDWLEAADYYVSLHTAGSAYLLRETLAELEQTLDPDVFIRVHRS